MRSWFKALALIVLLAASALTRAQSPTAPHGPNGTKKKEGENEPPSILVSDAKAQVVYKDFIAKLEKLADDFDKQKQTDKAKACYEEILRLVPEYPSAKKALENYAQKEATAEKKTLDILATKEWQDTGVVVLAGKPLKITATGNWTFTLSRSITADGIAIPKELRDFNLGALIGLIQTPDGKEPKPFYIGAEKSFVAEKTGKLLMRMYDDDATDNKGKVSVEIQGTFEKAKP